MRRSAASLPENALFKYRVVNSNLRRILLDSTLWAGTYGQLNDPNEGSISYDFSGGMEGVRAAIANMPEDAFERSLRRIKAGPEGERILRAHRAGKGDLSNPYDDVATRERLSQEQRLAVSLSIGVCSFSRVGNSPAQFAYYADDQQGVCAAFDADVLGASEDLYPVEYVDSPPVVRIDDSEAAFHGYVTTKSTIWAHEQEVRLVRREGHYDAPDPVVRFPHHALLALILGPRCQGTRQAVIESWLRVRRWQFGHVPRLLRAIPAPGRYTYDLVDETPANEAWLTLKVRESFAMWTRRFNRSH